MLRMLSFTSSESFILFAWSRCKVWYVSKRTTHLLLTKLRKESPRWISRFCDSQFCRLNFDLLDATLGISRQIKMYDIILRTFQAGIRGYTNMPWFGSKYTFFIEYDQMLKSWWQTIKLSFCSKSDTRQKQGQLFICYAIQLSKSTRSVAKKEEWIDQFDLSSLWKDFRSIEIRRQLLNNGDRCWIYIDGFQSDFCSIRY